MRQEIYSGDTEAKPLLKTSCCEDFSLCAHTTHVFYGLSAEFPLIGTQWKPIYGIEDTAVETGLM